MTVALAGDTMLGRKVAERLAVVAPTARFSDEVVAVADDRRTRPDRPRDRRLACRGRGRHGPPG